MVSFWRRLFDRACLFIWGNVGCIQKMPYFVFHDCIHSLPLLPDKTCKQEDTDLDLFSMTSGSALFLWREKKNIQAHRHSAGSSSKLWFPSELISKSQMNWWKQCQQHSFTDKGVGCRQPELPKTIHLNFSFFECLLLI